MIQKSKWEKEAIKNAKRAFKQRQNSDRVKDIISGDLPEILPRSTIEVKELILTGILEGECPLEDDYPVFYGHTYVIDHNGGLVIISQIQGTIKDLKKDIRDSTNIEFTTIYNCKRVKRNIV